MLRSRHSVLLVAFVGLLLCGCRIYGGYDTEPKTYQAMQEAIQTFEDELSRAETDLQKLKTAAANADTLQSLAQQFHALLEEHKSLLQKQRDRVERLSPDASYRTLHNAYGATVSEQHLMQQNYQRVIRTVRATVQGTAAPTSRPDRNRRYTIRPIGFPTPTNEKQLTMERALRGLRALRRQVWPTESEDPGALPSDRPTRTIVAAQYG